MSGATLAVGLALFAAGFFTVAGLLMLAELAVWLWEQR